MSLIYLINNYLRYFIFIVFFLLSGTGFSAPGLTQQSIQEHTLDNGLKVIVKNDDRSPTVAFQLWYKMGSSYETPGKTGISHLLEHLMYKGYNNRQLNETLAQLNQIGARGNAFTGRDHTYFFHMLNKQHIHLPFQLEALRMDRLSATKHEFDIEKKVVLEEMQTRINRDPYIPVHQQLYKLAFSEHHYQHPVIGYTHDINKLTLNDAQRWHQDYYTPDNATLVITGDVNAQAMFRLAQRYFGFIRKQLKKNQTPLNKTTKSKIKRYNMPEPIQVGMVLFAFKVPSLVTAQPDWEAYALEILASWFDSGSDSILTKALVRKLTIANEISVIYSSMSRFNNLFIIEAIPAKNTSLTVLEATLNHELKQLHDHITNEATLQKIKNQMIATEIFERDSLYTQAKIIGQAETIGISWKEDANYIKRINAVTTQQIQSVFNKYFTDSNKLTVVQHSAK